jgi:hypothetical protein
MPQEVSRAGTHGNVETPRYFGYCWEAYIKFLEERAWKAIEAVHKRNKDVDPEQLEKDIEQALDEVRSKQR